MRSARSALQRSVLLLAMWWTPMQVVAQPRIELRPSCATCRITLTERVQFATEWDDGAMPTRPYTVVALGRDWLVVDADAGHLLRFNQRGQFLAPVGRKGAGPGEFTRPSVAFPWAADTVAVIDRANGRLSLLEPNGRVTRAMPWDGPSLVRVSSEREGGFVAPARISTRSSFGKPFHHFGRDGRLIVSFGAPADANVPNLENVPALRIPRHINRQAGFWAVNAREPALQFFGHNGDVQAQWRLPMPEFTPITTMGIDSPAGAEFYLVEPLGEGLLLVGMVYREQDAHKAFGGEVRIDGRLTRMLEDYSRFFDTALYVLDVRARSLVAMTTTNLYLVGSAGNGLYWGLKPGEDGAQLVIVHVALARP